ncbi:tetratricopeptide repeat-containing glycosyltransferase family 2 protein [Lederbergia lenta]|uniref:Glycosyl transferase, group 2 family protein n=1 Tax=Lederbergia lenta TaxID=1467 RepID=A0A2X4WPG1_LEDLE|nr:glycosyltransferase family 2 protein [Lederbergia lenta]MEC2326680.1 glycosyltransferase family 2 protein [Lederbergia lenta]SQI61588.1 glycosyl transferase, group 2 family protein [Lederbergia lenta]
MTTISLCMIVKNEENVIGRCLDSVRDIVDEIIIVDTGSTDRTKEIISTYTDSIFNFAWIDDFAAARNFSFDQATKEYILWLDADDIIHEEDREKLIQLKKDLKPEIDAVSMEYQLAFDEEGIVTSSLRRYRLVKRERSFHWVGLVHEFLAVGGNLSHSEVRVKHMPQSDEEPSFRNLHIYEKMLSSGAILSPRDLFYYANELMDHGFYEKAIKHYLQFLDTKNGWVEDNIRACNKLADCYQQLGLEDLKFDWTIRSLSYGPPQPETCCRIGFLFLQKEDYLSAAHWFEQAISDQDENKTLFFQNQAHSTWLPHLQLAVCYDRLRQYKLANQHNELAANYYPTQPSIVANQEYFKKVLQA